MKNWYIVQTFSGFEQKVAETLKDTVKKNEKLLNEKLNFAIREGGKTVGAGVVTKILE